MKILIGVPCMETIPVNTVESLLAAQKTKRCQIDVRLEPLSLVYIARERLVEIAIKGGYDYLMFLDSDMVFTPGLIPRLLDARKDIVSGLAFMRKPPYLPCVYKKMRIGEAGEKQEELLTDFKAGLVQVEGFGLACCLMKVDALKKLKSRNTNLFWPVVGYGEDLSFCIKARKEKLELWCDTNAKVGHIGQTVITQAEYDAWNEVAE